MDEVKFGAIWKIGERIITVSDFKPYRKSIALFIDKSPNVHQIVAYFRSEEHAKMFIQAMTGKHEVTK